MRLIELSDSRAVDRRRTGGKAASLAALVARGIPVPAGFVIPADAMVAVLEAEGLVEAARSGDPRVGVALRERPLPKPLSRAIRHALRRLDGPLAVRSSGISEDGAEASHAGQYETILGVEGAAAVEDAVRHCWASAFEPRALAYARRGDGALAVLVQQMVDPVCAGVLFTINPASNGWREMTVEAAGDWASRWCRDRRPRSLPGEASPAGASPVNVSSPAIPCAGTRCDRRTRP